jgi:hypothetical protein
MKKIGLRFGFGPEQQNGLSILQLTNRCHVLLSGRSDVRIVSGAPYTKLNSSKSLATATSNNMGFERPTNQITRLTKLWNSFEQWSATTLARKGEHSE